METLTPVQTLAQRARGPEHMANEVLCFCTREGKGYDEGRAAHAVFVSALRACYTVVCTFPYIIGHDRRQSQPHRLLNGRTAMNTMMRVSLWTSLTLVSLGLGTPALAQQTPMTFFITSTGPGKGADLGGLEGADRHCQALAQAAGAGGRTWRAYLSTQSVGGAPAVNARDRIGRGPWQNAKGVAIAKDIDELHGTNKLTKQTALNEKGEMVNGRGDTPNRHDILTGSTPDGRAFPPGEDRTCGNWTKSAQGAAMVGHHDRMGSQRGGAREVVEFVASVTRAGRRLQPG